MIYIRYTKSKISFSYIMYITIILCRNYLQIVRSNYVYFGQINESVCLCDKETHSLSLNAVQLITSEYLHLLPDIVLSFKGIHE